MDLPTSPLARERVEAFQRRHRVGVLTLLFTDLVGSTKLKQELGDTPAVMLLQQHDDTLRELLARFPEAEEIETAGDSFFIVFTKPSDAARFALLFQARLREWNRGLPAPVVDRVGIHVGEVFIQEQPTERKAKDLFGLHIDTAARVMSLAQGGQILLSRFAFDNARQALKGLEDEQSGPLSWLNHGTYAMKGVEDPVEICEVGQTGEAPLQAPPDSEKARRVVTDGEPVLGWRPALEQVVPGTEWVLERRLGEGGFGEVWLGLHRKLKERAVFKFCFRADRARSLKRELTLFRVLKERAGDHPNIVAVRDVYLDAPPYYLVTDFAEGQPLRAWCDAQGGAHQVTLAAKLEIVAQVADALQAAHEAGVIHRDVKPSNILVEGGRDAADVRVKLTDFGIGQVVSQEALAGLTRLGFTETMMPVGSALAGTQMYLAPELLAGRPASPRSDLYALGVVLYQLLSADLTRPLTQDWGRKVGEPLLREDLDQCFAGDPEERFDSTAQLAGSLRRFEERRQAHARGMEEQAARERAAYNRGAFLAGAVIGTVLLIAAWAFFAVSEGRQARREKARAYANREQAESNFARTREMVDQERREKEMANVSREQVESSLAKALETVKQYQREKEWVDASRKQAESRLAKASETADQDRREKEWTDERWRQAESNLTKAREAMDQYLSRVTDDPRLKGADFHELRRQLLETAVPFHEELVQQMGKDPNRKEEQERVLAKLASVFQSIGDVSKAEAAYRRALLLSEELASEFPTVPGYQRDLAASHARIGNLLSACGRVAEAEAAHRRALDVGQILTTNYPTVSDYQSFMGATLNNLARLLKGEEQLQEARALYEQAIVHQGKALAAKPKNTTYRNFLRIHQANLSIACWRVGDHSAATANALELPKLDPEGWEGYLRAAGFVAQCIPVAQNDAALNAEQRQQTAESYARRSVELLRQAIAKGYKDAAKLSAQKEYAALRDRPDFQELARAQPPAASSENE